VGFNVVITQWEYLYSGSLVLWAVGKIVKQKPKHLETLFDRDYGRDTWTWASIKLLIRFCHNKYKVLKCLPFLLKSKLCKDDVNCVFFWQSSGKTCSLEIRLSAVLHFQICNKGTTFIYKHFFFSNMVLLPIKI